MKESFGPKTIVFPMPAFLVGSYDSEGKANVMTAAWGGIACADPPYLSVAIRPSRWTYKAIMERNAFTINIPKATMATKTDFVGSVSGRRHDKFKEAGLTPVRSQLVDAPYVAECPINIECKVFSKLPLGSHTLIIGEIMDFKIDDDCLGPNNSLDISQINPLVYSPESKYYQIGANLGDAFSIGKKLKASESK